MDKPLNWKQALLLQLLVGLILIFCTWGLTRSGQKVDKNDATIKELAKIVYVDEHNKELREDMKKGLETKLDKETFAIFLKGLETQQKEIQDNVRDIRNFLINKK